MAKSKGVLFLVSLVTLLACNPDREADALWWKTTVVCPNYQKLVRISQLEADRYLAEQIEATTGYIGYGEVRQSLAEYKCGDL